MNVLLVGEDAPLLEGLSQSFAALGYLPRVSESLHWARESAQRQPPLVAVISGDLASDSPADVMAIKLAPGGVIVLYHGTVDARPIIAPSLQRAVMADLTLPLERNRLMALAQHVTERIRVTGRAQRRTPPEQQAF